MKIKGCRIRSEQSQKLLEFFVAGVTARTAAELAGVNRNSANLFYNKLRKIIVHFTELDHLFSTAKSRSMSLTSAVCEKANAVAVLPENNG